MTMSDVVEYRSEVDRWMLLLVWGACLLLLGCCYLVYEDETTGGWINGLTYLTTALTVPYLLWSIYGTKYRLTDTQLLVRSGPLRTNILLDDITSIEPVKSFLSSPALSRDRFLIRYQSYASVMISPDERGGFLQDVAARTPHLDWQDGKLTAVS